MKKHLAEQAQRDGKRSIYPYTIGIITDIVRQDVLPRTAEEKLARIAIALSDMDEVLGRFPRERQHLISREVWESILSPFKEI